MKKILIVDDDENVLSALNRTLKRQHWLVDTFSNPQDALLAAQSDQWQLIVSDYRMPGMDGVEFLQHVSTLQPYAVKLLMSANIDLGGLSEALNSVGIHRFITKPWDNLILTTTFKEALEHQHLLCENKRLSELVEQLQVVVDKQTKELGKLKEQYIDF